MQTNAYGPMQDMYEFFAFSEALDNGFTPDALVEEHAAKGEAHLQETMQQLFSQLQGMLEANGQHCEQLLEEASHLAPAEAKAFSSLLSERVKEMQITVDKQEREFTAAEKTASGLKEQNVELTAAIVKLRALINRRKEEQSRLQGQVYAAGTGFCQYISNTLPKKRV